MKGKQKQAEVAAVVAVDVDDDGDVEVWRPVVEEQAKKTEAESSATAPVAPLFERCAVDAAGGAVVTAE